jgi:hypothetical protein
MHKRSIKIANSLCLESEHQRLLNAGFFRLSFEGGITEPLEGDNGDSDYAHSLDIEDAEEDE